MVSVDLEQVQLFVGVLVGIIALAVFLKKALKSNIENVLRELQTGNGERIGVYAHKNYVKLEEVAGLSRDNRTLIEEHGRQIREVRDELVRHEITGHSQTDQ